MWLHAGCGSSGVFYHTNAAAESKMAREMLCFTIETAVGGPKGRRCRTDGCGLCSGYVRAMSALGWRYVRAGSFGSAM